MERLAVARGLTRLRMDASTGAEAFYAKHGYAVVERTTHRLRAGAAMACVVMEKSLAQTP